ncbi:MAG: zinc ribbon domain-containing protein [Oscillospiraceae bacterium]
MDLKTILEKEYHSVDTTCFGNSFTITPERNVYNVIRCKYKKIAIEACEKFKEMDKQFEDIHDLVHNAIDAFVISIENALMEVLQDIISIDIYIFDKQKIIEFAFDGDYFNEFEQAYGVIDSSVDQILEDLEGTEYARKLRKDTRSRWQSATIGGNAINAWSNQLETASMNLAEGAMHSIINAIGNAMDEAEAKKNLTALFNKQSLRNELITSVFESCFNIHLLLIDIVSKYANINIIGTISESDEEKAEAIFNNLTTLNLPADKRATFINTIFQLNPYKDDFYKTLAEKYGDEDCSFDKFSEYFSINILNIKNDILSEYVKENIGSTEYEAYKCKENMENLASKLGLDISMIVEAREIINEQLDMLDLQYRTIDGIVLETREQADTAKNELLQIQNIMKDNLFPTTDSTLSYERAMIEKREQIENFTTDVKLKYIKTIDLYIKSFDQKFRYVSLFKDAETREEAVRLKALALVKKRKYRFLDDVNSARQELLDFLSDRGLTIEETVEANQFLREMEYSLQNGINPNSITNKIFGFLGGKSYSDIASGAKSEHSVNSPINSTQSNKGMYCTNCGNYCPNSRFCPECGARMSDN